ncbi:nucleotidyltransferase family protein [Algoriphagus sp. Y33]|uniref:nucleotidyltransferase family protein n=1 Tax=Algoriphagus sp. Y33 TaxID=2772483 RepID=UPI0017851426|nr:nucleotidyltransferase domain-containing protein [Algoriphagus sp. Y33]
MDLIEKNREALNLLCKTHKVKQLFVFGSVMTTSFNDESDLDFLIDFDKLNIKDFATIFFEFKFALEDLFNRNIDLIEREAIRNPYFKEEVEETKLLMLETS